MTKQQNNEIQKQILDFLKDKNQRQVIINSKNYNTLFYKIDFDNLIYIFCSDFMDKNVIDIYNNTKNNFAGVINKATGKIYFDRHELYKNFEFYDYNSQKYVKNEEYEALKGQNEEELNEEINEKIKQEILKISKNVNAGEIDDEYNEHYKQTAENFYYFSQVNELDISCLTSKNKNITDLLQYIQNKDKYITDTIQENRTKIIENIEYKKAVYSIIEKFLQEIETNEEYKYLRLAKQIKDIIPKNAKQVVLYYKLNNGEVLQGKYEAKAFACIPYCIDNKEDLHYNGYNLDSNARKKINQVQSHDDYIKVKNILKIAYNGKTLYEQQ